MMKSRRTESAGHVARTGQIRNASKILVGKPEGKSPFGRSWSRWEDNIKSIPRVIRLESVDWIYLAQYGYWWRVLVNTVMKPRVP
jgi:hypothetical protein